MYKDCGFIFDMKLQQESLPHVNIYNKTNQGTVRQESCSSKTVKQHENLKLTMFSQLPYGTYVASYQPTDKMDNYN